MSTTHPRPVPSPLRTAMFRNLAALGIGYVTICYDGSATAGASRVLKSSMRKRRAMPLPDGSFEVSLTRSVREPRRKSLPSPHHQ